MSTVNKIDLIIDEKAHSYARIYASLISDEYQRKRAYASIAALYAFIGLVEKTPLNIQKSMTLFRNPILNEQYEISDIYINNWHIDVRVVTGSDAFLVPKVHYDNDLVPDFYVVIKIDSSVQNAELVGIADTSSAEKEAFDYHYHSIPFSSLISYDEFLERVQNEKILNFSEDDHELFREKYLGLMDNNLEAPVKNKIIKHLFECPECRTEFCCFTGFEMVCCNASKYPDLLNDQTLGIIGAQNVNDKKYEGKEETIYISDDEPQDNFESNEEGASLPEEKNEETVSDILDELFSMDEDFINSDSNNDKPVDTQLKTENISDSFANNEILQDDIQSDADDNFVNTEIISDDIPAINDDKDIEIIEEYDSSAVSDMPVIEENEVQMIYEEDNLELSKNDEFDIVEQNKLEEIQDNSDLVLIDHKDDNELITEIDSDNLGSELETISPENENISEKENVQKVIVDYDEFGEPIYSYITNIEQEVSENIDSSAKIIEEKEKFDEYPDYNEAEHSGSEIENIDDSVLSDTDDYKNQNIEDVTVTENEYTADNNIEQENIDNQPVHQYERENILNDNILVEDESTNEDENEIQKIPDDEEGEETSDMEESIIIKDDLEEDEEGNDDETGEYDDYDIEDVLPDENVRKSSSKVALIVISLLVVLGLAGGGAFLFLKNAKSNSNTEQDISQDNMIEIPDNRQTNDMFEQPVSDDVQAPSENNKESITIAENQPNQENQSQADVNTDGNNMPLQGSIPVPPLTESDLIQPKTQQGHGDVNKVIANAFSSQNSSVVSLRGLNWFCTSELFSDNSFKNYLQDLDNKLKQNLKNNILNATENPPNDSVAAKFAVDNNGNLQKVIISDSSGSTEIDNIVLQSINESFEGEKSQILNDSTLKADMYYLKVVIKL